MKNSLENLKKYSKIGLPHHLGLEVLDSKEGWILARLEVKPHHLAINHYLHGGTIVTLADTACGFGCRISLPKGAIDFTTIELKANFLGTATEGYIQCEAKRVHAGRTTQVWDATVSNQEGKIIALFRCTQMILYPKIG